MAHKEYDVLGIGNAIVDVLAPADDAFVMSQGLVKGAMALIDAERADAVYGAMGPGTEASGGSAANTIAGLASLGGQGAYIGRVCDDQLGRVFRHDITSVGVDFATPASLKGAPTARCLVMVTPDAQRTMATYLGACVDLTPADVDPVVVEAARITYLEGYLWDPENAKAAFRKAMEVAHSAGRKVALSLSDSFCVGRHRGEFLDLIKTHQVDILFANEAEITALFEATDFDAALQRARTFGIVAALTRGEKGSVVLDGGEVHVVDAVTPKTLVDSTGAGDLYASGFLYGLTHGLPLAEAAHLGGVCAAEVLGHYGPRPLVPLTSFL